MQQLDIEYRVDDLTGEATRALVAAHLQGMHASSPACSVHALDIDGLRAPDVTFWSAWIDGQVAAIGALKQLDARNGELKSMRVADAFLGRGLGRGMLHHIEREAVARGIETLWLETGSPDDFLPARSLYLAEGYVECGPFGDYVLDPFSVFMTKTLPSAAR